MTNNGKTLLVAEDEGDLLEVEAQILGGSGYRVLPAGDMAEALRVAAATTPIHLLLTDFWLPDGDGFELAHRFRVLHPQAPIILVSGSVTDLDGRTDGLQHFALIAKPFTFCELQRMISALLADTPPAAHGEMRSPLNSG